MLTHIENPLDIDASNFGEDVKRGLLNNPKRIPSKYLYDAKGGTLFQQITELPEYYLTSCEYEVFQTHKDAFLQHIQAADTEFNLIELGAGNASKTKVLLEHFVAKKANFSYTPIDISDAALDSLSIDLNNTFPSLNVSSIHKDYFSALENLQQYQTSDARKVILFLGSNIGNFPEQAPIFLSKLHALLSKGDILIIGFDLKKRPEVIYNAYNDSKSVTAAFNLNLLHRINRELGGNFKANNFRYYPAYNPQTGCLNSYLVSQKQQTIEIENIGTSVTFEKWGAIHTEVAKKYDFQEIKDLATQTGFTHKDIFVDRKGYFADVIWEI